MPLPYARRKRSGVARVRIGAGSLTSGLRGGRRGRFFGDEAFPVLHVGDEFGAQAFRREIGAGDGKSDRLEMQIGCDTLREVVMQDGPTSDDGEIGAVFENLHRVV